MRCGTRHRPLTAFGTRGMGAWGLPSRFSVGPGGVSGPSVSGFGAVWRRVLSGRGMCGCGVCRSSVCSDRRVR
jgi:hypothetical protein